MAHASIAQEITQALGETNPGAISRIIRIVRFLGAEQAQALLSETQQIEASGGMMLPDGSRRRTSGGVYFYLARNAAPKDQRANIFGSLKHKKPATPKSTDSPESTTPATAKPEKSADSPEPTIAIT